MKISHLTQKKISHLTQKKIYHLIRKKISHLTQKKVSCLTQKRVSLLRHEQVKYNFENFFCLTQASFVAVQSLNFPLTPSLCPPTPTCELWSSSLELLISDHLYVLQTSIPTLLAAAAGPTSNVAICKLAVARMRRW